LDTIGDYWFLIFLIGSGLKFNFKSYHPKAYIHSSDTIGMVEIVATHDLIDMVWRRTQPFRKAISCGIMCRYNGLPVLVRRLWTPPALQPK